MIDIDEVSYKRTKFRQAGLEAAAGIASEGDTAASDAANASAPGHVRISAKAALKHGARSCCMAARLAFATQYASRSRPKCSWTQMNASYASIKSAEAGLN